VDFSRVLVTDRLAWEIFGAAAREKLLFVQKPADQHPRTRSGTAGQRALSLLILFDHLIIHDFGPGTFRLPDLEKEGIVEIIPAHQFPDNVSALSTKWRKGRLGSRGRPPKQLLQSLSLVQQFRPLVVNRLLKGQGAFDSLIAEAIGVSRRQYINVFLDYALAYAQGDEATIRDHVLTKVLPNDVLHDLSEELFDFKARGELLSAPNAMLLIAIAFAEEIAVIQSLSTQLGLGVATDHYGERFRSEPALRGKQLDAVAAAHQFLILRAALADEGRFMPRIEGIKHALALRRDPHLKAVREQLKVFHSGLISGDRSAVREARHEIQQARQRLERRSGWDRALRCLAYISVPVGIAESLIWSVPIAGTALSVIGAAGAATVRRLETKNEWVLFGT